MRRRRTALALVGLAIACAAGAHILAPSSSKAPPAKTAASQPATATASDPARVASAPADAKTATAASPAAPVPSDPAAFLRDALTWQDDGARIDAIDAVIASGATQALPVLEHVVLQEDPEGSPTIIHGVAVLGARAGAAERHEAGKTLATWLHDESMREGADARGNVSVLIDALGDLGGPDGAAGLVHALDGEALPLHVQTLAAQRLTALGDPAGPDAIARFSARVAAMPKTEGIDEALREEALAVASNVQP